MKSIPFWFSLVLSVHMSGQTNYFTVREEKVPIRKGALFATLFTPVDSKNPPVVLMIAGSGPTDRDGNNYLLPGKNNSLLQLADSLAKHGIASLRYDKRGVGKSRSDTMIKEENITVDTIADDAAQMYQWLKAQGYHDIFILGHSEGSLIGMMISATLRPQGFISIAGAGRKIREILNEQLSGQLPVELYTRLNHAFDSLEEGLSVTPNPALYSFLRPSIQPYMKSWLKLDPQEIIAKLNCPVLIVQGSRDIQVSVKDAEILHNAKDGSKILIIPNMNHVFKQVETDDRNANVKTYSDPSYPVMTDLVSGIVMFIKH
jgi:pimeloyl-ACP methyl ester carboxylesterase